MYVPDVAGDPLKHLFLSHCHRQGVGEGMGALAGWILTADDVAGFHISILICQISAPAVVSSDPFVGFSPQGINAIDQIGAGNGHTFIDPEKQVGVKWFFRITEEAESAGKYQGQKH